MAKNSFGKSFTKSLNEALFKFNITKAKYLILLGVITAVVLFIATYVALVPFNLYNAGFRALLVVLLLIWSAPLLAYKKLFGKNKQMKKSPWLIPLILALAFIVTNLAASAITAPLFMAKRYRALITVNESHSFIEDVENYDTMQIPVVDKYLAEKLGDKKLGEDNLGSQFNVGEYYMICHESNLYWIAPIEFNGFFPWVNRKTSPGYVMVNANDQGDVRIIKSELKYTDSAFLGGDLDRKNYFNHPTTWRAMDAHLELTDEGEPRFVETVYTNKLGYTNGRDIKGIIITDPKTGKSEYKTYLSAPTWINHVLTEEVIIEQLNYWGRYVNGFFNSVFAKNEVLEVSTGVNYVYSNGNMYLQTGMTSVGSDESIVGVMMVDMRTKEAFFYRIGGATEYAAAQSAIGKDQEKRYTATDPIMINMNGIPTYFVMLKDDEGLVKRYAYVNVQDYRLVATADTQVDALIEYKKLVENTADAPAKEHTVKEIVPVMITGSTYYYIRLNTYDGAPDGFEEITFRASLELNPALPFIKAGDTIKIKYLQSGDICEISELEAIN